MRDTAYIYTLEHPITGEIRYVGKTFDLRQRLYDHICTTKRNSKKIAWVKSLKAQGLKPKLEIIETLVNVEDWEWEQAEQFWIESLRFYGCRLTNMESGGRSGKRMSKESIAKRIAATKPRIMSEEERLNRSEKQKANFTPEVRARMLHYAKTNRHTDEAKKAISESKIGKPRSESERAALLEGSRQWKLSQGLTPRIICISCRKVIKVNRLKSGLPNDKQKWFREGIGYIHNLCLKKLKNLHSANGCTTSAVTTN